MGRGTAAAHVELALTPVPVRLAPDLAGHGFGGGTFAEFAELPMLRLFDRPISGWSRFSKAVEDIVLAAVLLVILAPLTAMIAVAIKIDSPGPVLFRQTRKGFNNSLIPVWKFRTMFADATDAAGAVQARRGDPRVTRIGRILRRTSLDELPQLLDVLGGRMSLVGPRPHALSAKAEGRLFEEVVHRYAARHRVKPGITGWAQVNGWRGETDTIAKIQRRVEHDLFYIDNWSIWFDVRILIRTVWHVLRADNAI